MAVTRRLFEIGVVVYPMLLAKSSVDDVSAEIRRRPGLGHIWAKMLVASMQLLLPRRCALWAGCVDVGDGAQAPLLEILYSVDAAPPLRPASPRAWCAALLQLKGVFEHG